ncbi:S-adenosylmethionine mitochondrial carrier protein isoform X2 [Protopterus annectens]|uniref:S-adenosylmethionine mitochondrial carrier protein isoform X2 n=1 Tax=Protopterus annectens TaxID=7888 RepID=UPI001CFA0724|nr:S-adenosylmethionine mitochondrial carrier protein isoform X2 [Protopterus annectens]
MGAITPPSSNYFQFVLVIFAVVFYDASINGSLKMKNREFVAALIAGGTAGICVDLTLFPLDTIKTRLQSPQGFYKAGGFRGIYAGVPSAAVGSFPNAASFFLVYEYVKSLLGGDASSYLFPVRHLIAASVGETVACLIRVPTEVIKQRTQASPSYSTYQVIAYTLKQEGFRGLYRGYKSTLLREIPFSLVQFPLWELLKGLWSWKQGHASDSWQSAVCGAFAGAKDYVILGTSQRRVDLQLQLPHLWM